MIYDQNKVEMLRQRYPEGTRICLDSMENDPHPIPSGAMGTVKQWMTRVLCIVNLTMAERLELYPMWITSINSIKNRLRPMSKQRKIFSARKSLRILKNQKKWKCQCNG